MKITLLNSSENHPINEYLSLWINKHKNSHQIELLRSKKQLIGGDVLFLVSCSEILFKQDREKFKKTLVIHASDLPTGRGWSPHIWEIINGAKKITVTLLEAENEVDSGDIWKKIDVNIPGTALYKQINKLIFEAELNLMDFAIGNFEKVIPIKQKKENITYWQKRAPKDSEIDILKSIDEQFNLIRVCDPDRYPAFFRKNGKKFSLKIEEINEESDFD